MDILNQFRKFMESSSISRLIQIAAVLVIGLVIIKIVLQLTRRALNRSRIDSVLYSFVINCVKIGCLVLLALNILSLAGFPTSTFLTVLAAAGAAVALAVKDSLSNFAGGLLILVSKPFNKGDLIESSGVTGKVQEINLLYSKLVTFDNRVINLPNSVLANSILINYSGAGLRRVDLKIGVGYEADPDMVIKTLRKALEKSKFFLPEPEPVIGISDYGDSAIVFDAFAWCRTEDYFDAKYDYYKQIKNALDREDIDIPYSQIVIHIADKPEEKQRNTAEEQS